MRVAAITDTKLLGSILVVSLFLFSPLPASAQTDYEELKRTQVEIERRGLNWTAGENDITRLSPEEKAKLYMPFGSLPEVPSHLEPLFPLKSRNPLL